MMFGAMTCDIGQFKSVIHTLFPKRFKLGSINSLMQSIKGLKDGPLQMV